MKCKKKELISKLKAMTGWCSWDPEKERGEKFKEQKKCVIWCMNVVEQEQFAKI